MEKTPVNPVGKIELPKAEQSVEHFSLSEQEKNIQEIFKLCPELENIAKEAIKSGEIITLYRIENKNIDKKSDGITSHEDLKGQWFSPDLDTALTYLRKSQQTFGADAKRVEGANLVIVKVPKEEYEKLHVSNHPVASQMDVENDNYIIPENIEREYINLDDVQDKVGNFENFQKAKEQVKEKMKSFEQKEVVELYQEYLKTIFPESKVKNILWHGTTSEEEFENFDFQKESSFGFDKHGGIFFTSMIEDAQTRGSGKKEEKAKRIIPVVLNVKNPLVTSKREIVKSKEDCLAEGKEQIENLLSQYQNHWEKIGWEYRIENNKLIVTKPVKVLEAGLFNSDGNLVVDLSQNMMYFGNITEYTTKPLARIGYDTLIDTDAADKGFMVEAGRNEKGNLVYREKSWYLALDQDKVHILGSKSDIEKFKEFVSKNENKEMTQSIEEFLKENGIEHVPHIETNFLFHKHATKEDGENVASKLDNTDILIHENAGWDKERLETWRKISRGELTADEAIKHEKERGKEFWWNDYYKAIFEKLHDSNKEVLLVDVESNDEVFQEIYELLEGNSIYNNLVNRESSYEETLEQISNYSELESLSQKERENKILENMKTNLLQLLKEKPELQNKENLNILFPIGAFHTRLYHETKKRGDSVSQEFSPSPYIFDPRQTIERKIHFLGIEKAKDDIPKILLYWLLRKSKVMNPDNITHKALAKFSEDQIRELFNMYHKSESDDQFNAEAVNWIVQQFKK